MPGTGKSFLLGATREAFERDGFKVFGGAPSSVAASGLEQEAGIQSFNVKKLLYEIDNVEYIYSISQPSGALIIVRYLVGTDPDQAALRVHTKLASAMDQVPEGVLPPVVKPRTIDDVPVAAYTLWGKDVTTTQLRQVADELRVELTRHPEVAQTCLEKLHRQYTHENSALGTLEPEGLPGFQADKVRIVRYNNTITGLRGNGADDKKAVTLLTRFLEAL